mmetsp:Transcript_12328/g.16942  ORF Transcript_12328/g.16942 Transcript_12328/m.16942 type:complete len:980 (+) Transcript_12328:88-3027(+)
MRKLIYIIMVGVIIISFVWSLKVVNLNKEVNAIQQQTEPIASPTLTSKQPLKFSSVPNCNSYTLSLKSSLTSQKNFYITKSKKVHPTRAPTTSPHFRRISFPSVDVIGKTSSSLAIISSTPSTSPSVSITMSPTASNSALPTQTPASRKPTQIPSSNKPTQLPTTSKPTQRPTTTKPTQSPTLGPTLSPTKSPSVFPSNSFTPSSAIPSFSKSVSPSFKSSIAPTKSPSSVKPTVKPTNSPSRKSSSNPTITASSKTSQAPTSVVPGDIVYHMGFPVMTGTVTVYNIYYGDFISNINQRNSRTLLDYLAANIGGSDYYNILTDYYQVIKGNTTKISNSVVFGRSVTTATSVPAGSDFSDTDAINTIVNLINTGTVPLDQNAVYFIIFPGNFNVLNPPGWLYAWCGYHSSFTLSTGETLKYAVMGDPTTSSDPILCSELVAGTINGNIGGDSMASTYAHELADTVTDAYLAWNIVDGTSTIEIADLCTWDFGVNTNVVNWNTVIGTKKFLLQRLWLPGYGCTLSLNLPTSQPTPLVLAQKSRNKFIANATYIPAMLPTVSPALLADVSYHGGPILIGNVSLYNIYLGDFNSSSSRRNTARLMNYFSANIGNTAWYNVLTSYYQIIGNTTTYASNQTVPEGSFYFSPTATDMKLTDVDLQNMIANAMTFAQLPVDENGVYTVMFHGNFTLTFNGKRWLSDFCSYHSAFLLPSGLLIKYAVIGDPSSAPGKSGSVCQPSVTSSGVAVSANGDVGADSMASEYAQNLAEVVTDFFGAWYSNRTGFEVGGACRGQFGPLVNGNSNLKVGALSFLVQKLWQPGYGCTMSKIISSSVPSPTSLSSWSPSVNPSIAPSTTTFPSSAPTSILTASPSSSTVFNRFPSGSPFRLTVPPSVTSTSSPNCNHGNGNGNGNGNCGKSPSTNSPTVSASKIPSASPRSLNAVNTPTVLTSTKPTIAVPTTPTTLKSNRPSAKPTARSKVNANY